MPLDFTVDNPSCEIWERIAFYTVTGESEETFLGPPAEICSLVLLCRAVYRQISFQHNTHLYARIFRYKFDFLAPARRLSERWRTTKCLAFELIKRWKALKRIKATELNVEDLWTAYLMMSENDGKNSAQLLKYACFDSYLQSLIIYRGTSLELAWHRDHTVDSLVLWLLWQTSRRESIKLEDWAYRQYLLGVLHSFIITGYRHSSVYALDCYFTLPLCRGSQLIDAGGVVPRRFEVVHYSHRLQIAAPVVAPAVVLSLTLQADSFQDASNIPLTARNLPHDRASAIAGGMSGPTLDDIVDFHLKNRVPTMESSLPLLETEYVENLNVCEKEDEDDPDVRGSKSCDEDWYRMVACHDPRDGDAPLRGVVYKLGSIGGSWAGRFQQADLELFTSLESHRRPPSATVSVRHRPLYWELREHHCLSPNEPLSPGVEDDAVEDVLNAWIPKGTIFRQREDALEVYDPTTGKTTRYENAYSRDATFSKPSSEKPSGPWISGEESDGAIAETLAPRESVFDAENPDNSLGPTPSIDDDDVYEDTVSYLSSGVADILITGKTGEHYGEAWGHFSIYGRVRAWDGLIVLLRVPSNPLEEHLGKWIFKGYLHGQNFVGRWRETSTPWNSIGYEGGFVVYKTGAPRNL